jgi:hypothetical protein
MGMVCTALMLVTMFIIGYRETTNRKNWNIVAIMATVIVILLMALRGRNILTGLILEIEEFFSSRASLFDNAGRFTIWKSNFIYLFEQNRIWFGVGQNQISNLTSQGKAFHNTWLEWLSGTGIFIGTGICLWFITAPRVLKRKCYEVEVDYRHYFEPLVLAYWTVLIAVTTVDNITNSVMLFLLVLFRYGIVESSSGSGVTKDFMIRQ